MQSSSIFYDPHGQRFPEHLSILVALFRSVQHEYRNLSCKYLSEPMRDSF